MPDGFRTFRVLLSTPPELARERDAFHAVLADYGGEVLIPNGALFATASFRSDFNARASRHGVEDNIRNGDFFLAVFGTGMPDAEYAGFVELAIRCAADPESPMRRPVVLFRQAPSGPTSDTQALRDSVAGRCDLRDYASAAELSGLYRQVLADWYAAVQ